MLKGVNVAVIGAMERESNKRRYKNRCISNKIGGGIGEIREQRVQER